MAKNNKLKRKKQQVVKEKKYKVTARFASEKEFNIFITAMKIVNGEARIPNGYAPLNPNVFAGNCCTQIGVNIIQEYQAKQKAEEEAKAKAEASEEDVTNEGESTDIASDSEDVSGIVDDNPSDVEEGSKEIVSDGAE